MLIGLDASHPRHDIVGREAIIELLTQPYYQPAVGRPSLLGAPINDRGRYIVFDVPDRAVHPSGRSDGLSGATALNFIHDL